MMFLWTHPFLLGYFVMTGTVITAVRPIACDGFNGFEMMTRSVYVSIFMYAGVALKWQEIATVTHARRKHFLFVCRWFL